MAWNKVDLKLLCLFATGRKFIMETGGGGLSTKKLGKVARNNGSIMVSIEVDSNRVKSIKGVDHQVGWSVGYEDMVREWDKEFIDWGEEKYHYADRSVVLYGEEYMKGKRDLIRKSIEKYGPPDFFFCDTGAYCGLAEWNIVKEVIPINGIFACHDIYYPKSIKCFQVSKNIEDSDQWEVLHKTKSKQGLLISRCVK